jgi:hypothetical protein
MDKTIILVHGRGLKPPKQALERVWIEALRYGIERDHPDKLEAFDQAELEFVYYGNISNLFLGNPNYDDDAERRRSLDELKTYQKSDFNEETYNDVPGKSAWMESCAKLFGNAFSVIQLSELAIQAVAPDMREYWNPDTEYGTDIRYPMIEPLKRALDRPKSQTMVISHSSGALLAYDTFWKFCHYGEYRPHYTNLKIDMWLTLGSPLADDTVKRHLKGGKAHGHWRYPTNVRHWVNFVAEDDYIAHNGEVAKEFAEMVDLGLIKSIEDKRIYNLAVREGQSNPHHAGGYLIHPDVAEVVANWL